MNNELGPSKQDSSSILSLSSVGATTSASTASRVPRGSWRDCSFRAHTGGASQSITNTAFHNSLEEDEDSTQSLSDSLNCDHIKSGARKRHIQGFHSEFSDSLDDSSDDIEENTFDSDTCSFYSFNSQLTPHGISSEVSLLDSKYYSEGTLYDSAQSLTPVPSCQSSFWSLRSCETLDESHKDHLSYQGNPRSDLHRPINTFYLDCTSCPDLSPSGIRKENRGQLLSTGLNPFPVSQAISDCYINSQNSNASNSTALVGRKLSDSSMSAVEGSASPKVGDEFETKKKKGLMSSFRKSRKTSRKLRQQKKAAAADGDTTSTGTGVMSDGEQDLLLDSESSAPNSPAPVKNALMKEVTTDNKIPINKNSETGLDCHQTAHERLNGTSTPKESSEPSSKSSSPLMGKSNRVAETAKKFEEKEEKKLGKNKFGSSLFRKKKAEQLSTQQSSKDSTDTTEPETPEFKDHPKTEAEQPSTDDSLPEGTSDIPASEQAESADVKSSSFRSYISSVQLVKNWTVNSDMPKSQLSTDALAKTSHDAVDGGKVVVEGKAITPEGTSTTTIETKKVTTASANGKPSATEVTSKKTTTVTIVSKQQSPKLRGSPMSVAGRGKGAVSQSSTPVKNPKVSPVNTPSKNISRRSKSPSPVLSNKIPFETTATTTTDSTKTNKSDTGINSPRHQPPPPVTVTPSESVNPTNSPHSESSQVGKAVTDETQQPPRIVITQQSPEKVVEESSHPKHQVPKESQPSRETHTNGQAPKTLSKSSQPLQKVTVNDPLQSKYSVMNQSQEPKNITTNEQLQSKRVHENKQPIKVEPSGEPQQPKRVPLRLNAGDTAVTPNQVPLPVLPSPGMVTPPSSPEGNSERDARETPEGDRTENEKNSLLDSTGLTDSWAGASTDKREHLYKILVIGELGTGKTSIIKRYVHQFFSQHYRATIGVDFALKVLNWDNNTVIRLQLWDIAGQERFGNMTRVYYKEAVGAFVVFDVTRAQTFDAVTKWKTDLDTKVTLADGSPIPTVLLANKCDQPKEGVVNNPARMDDYCRERGFSGWFETSAKENINIDEASRFLVNKILSNEKQGMMLTESLDTDKFSVDGKANPVDRSGCRC